MKLVATFAALVLGASQPMAPAAHGRVPSLEARIDDYVRSLARRDEFSGTVLVARGGRVIFEQSYGMASAELGVPNANEQRYRIHSITKQFIAMAVSILAERGAVDLHASIRAYLPELPAQWQPATVEQLLTHRSGIPQLEHRWFGTFQQYDSGTQLENLARLARTLTPADTLVSAPGATFAYSNFGYDLLGCLIERASGKSLDVFMRDAIFGPAGMTDAGFDARSQTNDGMYVASAMVPRLSSGYNGSPKHLQPGVPLMFGSAGAGGMYATARDLLQYDRALDANALISPDGFRRMIDNAHRSATDSTRAYGYGWLIQRPVGGPFLIGHSGGNNGFVAEYARYPDERLCIVVLSNYGFSDPEGMRKRIAAIIRR